MSISTTTVQSPAKILQRQTKWGLAPSRRKSAATLMNYMRLQKTEMVQTRIQSNWQTSRQAMMKTINENISAG